MQPIRLTLENFGPYENSEIEFSNYYAQSLFLITGKTGAGKTTIFDGMTYALYDKTSGGLRQGKEMRSNFAEVGDKTKVTFEFKQEGKTYKIEREPAQMVKKQRGDGLREQPAGVRLTVFDENGKEINQLTKQTDVAIFINQLIQLNEQQFSQIVMLPQGEFRRFLNASSDEKEKVLRKLFNTYFYQDIASYLRQKKKEEESLLKASQQELQVLATQLEWTEDFQEKITKDTYYQEVLGIYEEQADFYKEQERDLKEKLALLKKEVATHQEKLQAEKKWLEHFETQEKLEIELTRLKEQQEDIEEKREQVETLTKVKEIQPTFNYLMTLQREQKSLASKEKDLLEKQTTNQELLEKTQTELEALLIEEKTIETHKETLKEITKSIPLFEKKQTLTNQQELVEKEIKTLTDEKTTISSQKTELTEAIAQTERLLKNKTTLTEEKYELTSLLEKYANQIVTIKDYQKRQKDLESKQQVLATYEQTKPKLEETLAKEQLNQRQLKSDLAAAQIAKLSLDLIEGEACPVCGSTEHPAPTHGKEMTQEGMELLETQLEKADNELLEIREEQATLSTKIAYQETEITETNTALTELAEEIGHFFNEPTESINWLATIEERQTKTKQKETDILAKLQDLEQKETTLTDNKKQLTILETKLTEKTEQLRVVETKQIETQTSLKELNKSLPSQWQSLEEMTAEATKLEQTIAKWIETTTSLTKEVTHLTEEKLILSTTLNSEKEKQTDLAGKIILEEQTLLTFLKDNDLTQASLVNKLGEVDKLDEFVASITDFEKREYALEEENRKLATLLKDKDKPIIEPLLQMEQELTEKLSTKEKTITQLETKMNNNQKTVDTIKDKEAKLKDNLDALNELSELSNVMTGDGSHKLSIERFVLQTYLKKILDRANEKLVVLTNGRYRFELKEEQGSYKKQTGLEINIYDDNAGSIRSVNTLSGGESFIAALSLALSLAEVIQEEAGGIKIDAMFIDEGFGSLDEDALEMAIRALESIEGEGRLIGIISHVRELRERIPQQLQVKSTPDGKSYVNETLEFK